MVSSQIKQQKINYDTLGWMISVPFNLINFAYSWATVFSRYEEIKGRKSEVIKPMA